MEIKTLGNVGGGNTQSRTVYSPIGLCPTLCSGMDHGNTMPWIVIEVLDDEREFKH